MDIFKPLLWLPFWFSCCSRFHSYLQYELTGKITSLLVFIHKGNSARLSFIQTQEMPWWAILYISLFLVKLPVQSLTSLHKWAYLRQVRLRERNQCGRPWDVCRQPTCAVVRGIAKSQNNPVTQVGLYAEDGRGTVETKVRQVGGPLLLQSETFGGCWRVAAYFLIWWTRTALCMAWERPWGAEHLLAVKTEKGKTVREILKTVSIGTGQLIGWNIKGKHGVNLRGLTINISGQVRVDLWLKLMEMEELKWKWYCRKFKLSLIFMILMRISCVEIYWKCGQWQSGKDLRRDFQEIWSSLTLCYGFTL